jgi:hypothetical protein
MQNENPKEGISVKEIENFAKNNRFKLFLCLSLLLACFFSFIFFSVWSLILAAVGGILLPSKVEMIIEKIRFFCEKQENVTQLILGCVGLILAIFLPLLIFLALGLAGGKLLGSCKKIV